MRDISRVTIEIHVKKRSCAGHWLVCEPAPPLHGAGATVPTTPIVKMLKEISDIKNGVSPKIFRIDKKTSGGRPAPISDHFIKAAIVAAIEILMEGAKLKKSDALDKVSKSLKGYMTTAQLDTLRKKVKSRKINKDGLDSFFQYKMEGLASDKPVDFALSVLETASKYLE